MAAYVHHRTSSLWSSLFLAAGSVATVSYFSLEVASQSLLNDGVAVAAGGLMLAGVAVHRPEPRFAWTLLACGILMLAAGDILYGTSAPVPSPADALYMSAYPMLVLGLLGITRNDIRITGSSAVLDAILIAAGIGITAIVFLMVPASDPLGIGWAAKFVSAGYPILDLLLIGILIRSIRSRSEHGVAYALLGLGLALLLGADVAYMLQGFGTAYAMGGAADGAWLLAYVAFGAALLHPSIRRQATNARPVPPPPPPPVTRTAGHRAVGRGTAAGRTAGVGRAVPARGGAIAVNPALRFRLVLSIAGSILMFLSLSSLLLATAWQAPGLVMLAPTYGGMGALIVLVSRLRY